MGLPSVADEAAAQNPATRILGVSSYDNFYLFGRYGFTERIELRGGIDNLFDKDPPIVGANPGIDANRGVTMADYYDVLGRRYYLGVTLTF